MTALNRYQRLETLGLWRERPDSQRREVAVAFGDASLVISDTKSDVPLAHWSLPAVNRLNPGHLPALYSPAPDATEVLEIDDGTMISALDQVQRALRGQEPRHGRLRLGLRVSFLTLVAGLAVLWLPGAIIRHTATLVPESKQAEIGRLILADMVATTGAPCNQPEGLAALAKLRDRVLGAGKGELVVLPTGIDATARLPGHLFLLSQTLIEQQDNPDIIAAYVVAESLRADLSSPMVHLLRHVGMRATITLLTTGDLPPQIFAGYGASLAAEGRRALDDATLAARLNALSISAAPYARSIDPGGATTAALLTGPQTEATPVLDDADWVTLQGICSI